MPKSINSASTNTEIEGLRDLLENEEARYVSKGYGLISASLLTFSFFFILPEFLFPYYSLLPHTDKFIMFTWGPIIIHTTMVLVSNFMMFCIYKSNLEFFERYKITSDLWPWQLNYEEFKGHFWITIKTLIINDLIIMPLSAMIPTLLDAAKLEVDPAYYPSSFELIWSITFFMIIEDTVFYWLHRLLHTRFFYKNIHKKHHEYKITISIAAEYANPIEFIFGNLLPTSVGPLMLGSRCHVMTWYLWMIVRILETTDGHCGYEFSWSPFRLLPLSGSANYHNFHHAHNIGNFSSFFTYWDTICSTNKHYWRYLAKQEKEA